MDNKTRCAICYKDLNLDSIYEDVKWIDGLGHICLDCDCNLEETV